MSKTVYKAMGYSFLDPARVGSSLRWRITVNAEATGSEAKYDKKGSSYVDGAVYLTDCHRTIEWWLGRSSLDKLDAAIRELTEARKALAQAIKAEVAARKSLGIQPLTKAEIEGDED